MMLSKVVGISPIGALLRGLSLCAALCSLGALNASSVFAKAGEAAPQAQSLDTQPLMVRTQAGKQHFFTVEVADDVDEQRIGLMHRTSMDVDRGMIFIYGKPRQIGMWMKNTLISLDMLFLDAAGRVLNIHERAVPHSLQSIRSAGRSVAVVELAAGQAEALGLRAGDQVFHCQFKNFPCDRSPAQ